MWHELITYLSHHDSVAIAFWGSPAALLTAYASLSKILSEREDRRKKDSKEAEEKAEKDKMEKERARAEEMAAQGIADGLEARTRTRAILESLLFPLITADAALNIIDWPDTACVMFGWTEREAAGKNVSFIIPDDMKPDHFAGFNHYLETGKSKIVGRTVQVRGLHKDGRTFPISLSITKEKDPDDTPYYIAAIMPYGPPLET